MNKILSDSFIAKLKKVPVWGWIIIYAASALFAELYSLIAMGTDSVAQMNQTFAAAGLQADAGRLLILLYPLSAVILAAIFEIVAYVAYTVFSRRSFTTISQKEFVFRARFLMAFANIVIGLVNLIYFISPLEKAMPIIQNIVPPILKGMILIYFMKYICENYVSPQLRKKSFSYIAMIYLGIILALNFIQFIGALISPADYTVIETVGSGLGVLSYLLLALTQYFVCKDINVDGDAPSGKDDNIFTVEILPPEKDDTVFKDFDI